MDLLVVGEINADLIVSGSDLRPEFGQVEKLVEQASLTIGSSSVITACGAARLGLRTAFIGVVGDDPIGHFMLEAMAARGIDTSACVMDSHQATGISIILNDANRAQGRAILTAPGAIGALTADRVDMAVLAKARHIHCGSYYLQPKLQPGLPELFREAGKLGLTRSLDTNWDPTGRWEGGLDEALSACDLFFPNAEELQR
ncbi:MAG TPA: carbohydrate kinase family protein, partial [Trueperaceae bacterium]